MFAAPRPISHLGSDRPAMRPARSETDPGHPDGPDGALEIIRDPSPISNARPQSLVPTEDRGNEGKLFPRRWLRRKPGGGRREVSMFPIRIITDWRGGPAGARGRPTTSAGRGM